MSSNRSLPLACHGDRRRCSPSWCNVYEGVVRSPLREEGLVGTPFLPQATARIRGDDINGSAAASTRRAQLHASRGYAALALAYKAPGLSDYISNTPLEYFREG